MRTNRHIGHDGRLYADLAQRTERRGIEQGNESAASEGMSTLGGGCFAACLALEMTMRPGDAD